MDIKEFLKKEGRESLTKEFTNNFIVRNVFG